MSSTIRKHVRHQKIIVIGASTGGPKALQQVLQDLPTTFVIPILIAQHMPKKFTASFAERLNRHSHLHVKEATDEEIIQEGTVYLGPGDQNMMVHRNDKDGSLHIRLDKGRSDDLYRPSVNELFASVAKLHTTEKIAVILTGMGKDGKNGISHLKASDKKAIIIAESPDTAVIDGMPKAAIHTQLVTEVVRLENIGATLDRLS